ncbi:hypothetical protein FBF27_03770 [Candidatus Saccharibacteria bacterium oral taxon 488]|nr:hypothetical protein FBF27_03770 [Candidatus Saccharibacteria bacterium oral taxon 488]
MIKSLADVRAAADGAGGSEGVGLAGAGVDGVVVGVDGAGVDVDADVPPEVVSGVAAVGADGPVGAAGLGAGLAGRGAGVWVGATGVEPLAGGAASGGESLANATTGWNTSAIIVDISSRRVKTFIVNSLLGLC